MGRNLLIALCLWSCILIVNCEFSDKAVKKVTDEIRNKILKNIWKISTPQVAFIVKLTDKECSNRTNINNTDLITDIPEDFSNAIKKETKQSLDEMEDAMNKNVIYSGNQILIAQRKEVTETKRNGEVITYSEHAEYRLLTPEGKQTPPAQNFMNKEPKAHGVIFYSLISPCVDKCIKENNRYSILNSLQNNFQRFTDRAFVYKYVYTSELERLNDINKRQEIIKAWRGLDQIMPLFRCTCGTCERCFQNGEINEFCTFNKKTEAC